MKGESETARQALGGQAQGGPGVPPMDSTPVSKTRGRVQASLGGPDDANDTMQLKSNGNRTVTTETPVTADYGQDEEATESQEDGAQGAASGPNAGAKSDTSTRQQSPPQVTENNIRPQTGEYLYLSLNFVHKSLRTFCPPCPAEVQLEYNGFMKPEVYQARLADSSAKGYYCLHGVPKEELLNKEIFGICVKDDSRIILQLRDRMRPLASDEGRRRLTPRIIGITTSIRVDFLKNCFAELKEPRHPVNIRVEVNGVRQPELFSGASISHNRQGSFYVLGLPFALVYGREFVAWRQLDGETLELAVQDVDPSLQAAAVAANSKGPVTGVDKPGRVEKSSSVPISGHARKAGTGGGIVVDSRISIPLAMLKRDLGSALAELVPGGIGPSFEIPITVQYRVDGKLLPRVYESAVIKKSEHRGCCYLNGTERIPVKSKVLVGLSLHNDNQLAVLEFKTANQDELQRRSSPCVGANPTRQQAGLLASPPTAVMQALPGMGLASLGVGGMSGVGVDTLLHQISTGVMPPGVATELAAAFAAAGEAAAAGMATPHAGGPFTPQGLIAAQAAAAVNAATPANRGKARLGQRQKAQKGKASKKGRGGRRRRASDSSEEEEDYDTIDEESDAEQQDDDDAQQHAAAASGKDITAGAADMFAGMPMMGMPPMMLGSQPMGLGMGLNMSVAGMGMPMPLPGTMPAPGMMAMGSRGSSDPGSAMLPNMGMPGMPGWPSTGDVNGVIDGGLVAAAAAALHGQEQEAAADEANNTGPTSGKANVDLAQLLTNVPRKKRTGSGHAAASSAHNAASAAAASAQGAPGSRVAANGAAGRMKPEQQAAAAAGSDRTQSHQEGGMNAEASTERDPISPLTAYMRRRRTGGGVDASPAGPAATTHESQMDMDDEQARTSSEGHAEKGGQQDVAMGRQGGRSTRDRKPSSKALAAAGVDVTVAAKPSGAPQKKGGFTENGNDKDESSEEEDEEEEDGGMMMGDAMMNPMMMGAGMMPGMMGMAPAPGMMPGMMPGMPSMGMHGYDPMLHMLHMQQQAAYAMQQQQQAAMQQQGSSLNTPRGKRGKGGPTSGSSMNSQPNMLSLSPTDAMAYMGGMAPHPMAAMYNPMMHPYGAMPMATMMGGAPGMHTGMMGMGQGGDEEGTGSSEEEEEAPSARSAQATKPTPRRAKANAFARAPKRACY